MRRKKREFEELRYLQIQGVIFEMRKYPTDNFFVGSRPLKEAISSRGLIADFVREMIRLLPSHDRQTTEELIFACMFPDLKILANALEVTLLDRMNREPDEKKYGKLAMETGKWLRSGEWRGGK